jgi:hypothetical protein
MPADLAREEGELRIHLCTDVSLRHRVYIQGRFLCTSRLVYATTMDELAMEMLRLKNDTARRKAMAARAWRYADANTWDARKDEYL